MTADVRAVPRGRPPIVSAALVALLRERPRTVSEIATALYGADGPDQHAAAAVAIRRLRMAGIGITRTCVFSLGDGGAS